MSVFKRYRWLIALTACCYIHAATHAQVVKPPLGWNSWNSYGKFPTEQAMMANLNVFVKRLKPFGYRYFVIDAGWDIEKDSERNLVGYAVDNYGRYLPVKSAFPNGLKPLIDAVHAQGLKFGIHIMRGIPRVAYERNLPVLNTKFTAKDIADTQSTCRWNHDNYGVDMNKPGAQAYYDSYIALLAGWGVDFIKVDDITGHPDEVKAVELAIKHSDKNILLSLSPGGDSKPEYLDVYKQANMLRITADVWDNQKSIDKVFDAWKKWGALAHDSLMLDMDMLPFGHLAMNNPDPNYMHAEPHEGDRGTKAKERMSSFDTNQKYTFITQRALGASPIFMGGDLMTSDEFSFKLITNKEMLACDQNGVVGKVVYEDSDIEVWKTPMKLSKTEGWIGIFNRDSDEQHVELSLDDMRLKPCLLFDIWRGVWFKKINDKLAYNIPAHGVLFCRYKE